MLQALPPESAFLGIIEAAENYADDASVRSDAVAARKPLREAVRKITGKAALSDPLRSAVTALIDLTNDVVEGLSMSIEFSRYVLKHPKAMVKTDAKNEQLLQGHYLRDIFGNPFRPIAFDPSWRSDTAVSLAKHIYESRDFSAMPILADALQDAGCDSADILGHCRDANQVHVRGCWVVDLVLEKV